MGMTMAEKVLERAGGKAPVRAGQYITAKPDLVFMGDGLADVYTILQEANVGSIWDASKVVSLMDHAVPSPTIGLAEKYKTIRTAVRELGIATAYGERVGICHQALPEKGHVIPGEFILGLDSHSTTHGAFGAASTAIGYTEMAYVLKTGALWVRVPETIKFNILGELSPRVMSKDVLLHIAGRYSVEVAQYKAIEFTGPTARGMSVAGRMTMSNMGVELGAKFAFFEADEKTLAFLRQRTQRPVGLFGADADARYESVHEVDVSALEPQVSLPHRVDNVAPISAIGNIKIDQAFLGSCTNARTEDLEVAAGILEGRHIHRDVRMLVIPASWEVYTEAMRKGLMEIFIRAGALIGTPGCGPCCGTHQGILAGGERCIGSHNRNFKGRMGSNDAEVYLASPATVAASAIEGCIADPRTY
ncbi:MAG: 3-isopropylmalate dehydratase large subunit [candidate division NC10 bacterium]|nr:3-isopropylmalate dehydratase large subunit [candidate division NC10 bacterium]